jgi:mono/diheme cytochrome c family protein
VKEVTLQAGDEPGRSVADGAGRVHVVLRKGGAVVSIDPSTAQVIERRAVCAAPRGIGYQAASDQIHVACAGGELVSLPAAGGAAVRTLRLDNDLRDVVVEGSKLYVSRFRSAEVLVLDANGAVAQRMVPSSFGGGRLFLPGVAWRTIPSPGGGVLMLHQRALTGEVRINTPGGYGGGGGDTTTPCGGGGPIVQGTLSRLAPNKPVFASNPLDRSAVLPIDIARNPATGELTVLAAGNAKVLPLSQLHAVQTPTPATPTTPCFESTEKSGFTGEGVALAYLPTRGLAVQSREPAQIWLEKTRRTITLSSVSRADTGHAVFHAHAGGFLACASCHPEGGDDAHTWTFQDLGARRTQNLRGGILGTEPFHWDGDMVTFDHLVDQVFEKRMSGPPLDTVQQTVLSRWIDKVPTLPRVTAADQAAADRGKALFNDLQGAACASCHFGPHLSNNMTVDVGTGGKFQVPSLVGVSQRAPFMHDGCAATLRDRFGPCGGGDKHGFTSQLTSAQITDLVAYLETL